MKIPRFRLAVVLVVFAVVALVLGALQARRLNLKGEIARLESEGCTVPFDDHWLWPSAPDGAGVTFRQESDEVFTLVSKEYEPMEAIEHFKALRNRLNNLGVADVSMFIVQTRQGVEVRELVDITQL
jgi:hypothetical protein